jgi:hypothetical protein
MTSLTPKLNDDFLHMPKLSSDGKNWVIYMDQLQLSVQACRLDGHLDGTISQPVDPPACKSTEKPFKVLTTDKQTAITAYTAKLQEWVQKEAIVTQQIVSTILDSLYLQIKGKSPVKKAWDLLKFDPEKRSHMYMMDLRWRLQDKRCEENGNIHTHFDTMHTLHEDLAMLGDNLNDADFSAILLGSLPQKQCVYIL